MPDWTKETLKLKKGHGWSAPRGYRIFIADRGAVRFNFPQDWVLEPGEGATNFYDRQPPDDDCRLVCSYLTLPPIDWSGLHLSELIKTATEGDPRDLKMAGDIISGQRPDLEFAWADFGFIDPVEHRQAYSRICIARGQNLQTLITLDYWDTDGARLAPVWRELIQSLQLGRYVDDPTVGDIVH
jgi:hypothetical protein